MKFNGTLAIYLTAIVVHLSSLQSDNRITLDPQVVQQQTDDTMAFVALVDPWKKAIETYSQKNDVDALEIKCKNCSDGVLSIGEFDGCLMAWIIKAVPEGHEAFEKIKTLVEMFIKLLSDNASAEELINFMINTSNDMKYECSCCHGDSWKK